MKLRVFFNSHFVGAFILALALFTLTTRFEFQRSALKMNPYPLSPAFFKFSTGGFWTAAVDGLWIRTVQEIASIKIYSRDKIPPLLSFYRLATDLDPNFYELYEQSGIYFLFFFEDAPAATEMLEKGIRKYESGTAPSRFWTHPYTLHLFLANTYAFVAQDWVKAKQAYLKAAEVPGAPSYLNHMKEWLSLENSEKVLAVRVLKQLMINTEDEQLKERYRIMLKRYES